VTSEVGMLGSALAGQSHPITAMLPPDRPSLLEGVRAQAQPARRGRERKRRWTVAVFGLLALLAAGSSQAQLQRHFLNSGFEVPAGRPTGVNGCFFIVGADAIPNWNSSAPHGANAFCPPGVTGVTPGVNTGGSIEVWARSGVPSNAGEQFAEINAYQNSRLSQSVCLLNGDRINVSMGHRGRVNPNVPDVVELNVDNDTNTVLRGRRAVPGSVALPNAARRQVQRAMARSTVQPMAW
jgi:hypothetical protein